MHKLVVDSVQLSAGDRSLITDCYLTCDTGEAIGIFGRNGCGKSMLFKSIFGIHRPQQVYVCVDGKRVDKPYRRAGLMGYLPQFKFLPTGLSITQVFRDYRCAVSDFLKWFPDEAIGKAHRIGQLSTGQQRLIELYIIIRGNYRFVLLDEPFTYLAPVHIEKLQEIIRAEKVRKGILITDHQHQHVLGLTDRNYTIYNGALHEENK